MTDDIGTSAVSEPLPTVELSELLHARSGSPDTDALSRTIDALSLGQALIDFELANARVLDLTARLVEANRRVARYAVDAQSAAASLQSVSDDRDRHRLRADAAQVQIRNVSDDLSALVAEIPPLREHGEILQAQVVGLERALADTRAEMAALRSSTTFRLASKIGALKRLLR